MLYKNKNYSFKDLPDFQDGDVIDNCNCSQTVLKNIDKDVVFVNRPNMFNCNLTGNTTGKCSNVKKDLCYHLHTDLGLENSTGYQEGDTCGPSVEVCRHTDLDKVIIIESDEGNVQSFESAREDVLL